MSSMPKARFLPVVAMLMLVGGCGIYRFPPSPYNAHYNGEFTAVSAPDASAIRDVGVSWTFSRSTDEVWSAMLKVVHQYEGVLDLTENERGERRMVVIHGQPMFSKPPSGKNRDMVVSKYLDAWIAVAVMPGEDGKQTTVSAAWISPKTGTVAPLEAVPMKGAITPESGRVDAESKGAPKSDRFIVDAKEFRGGTATNLDSIASSLSDERNRVLTALSNSEKTEIRWQYVPRATINEFFYHLATQLYGPPRWREKFAAETDQPETNQEGPVGNGEVVAPESEPTQAQAEASSVKLAGVEGGKKLRSSRQRQSKDIETITDTPDHARLVFEAGQWTSASLRRSLVVVNTPPPLSELLEDIVKQVATAANRMDLKVTPYIVASPQINAFAVPNGDVFITSGLLEALESEDELAAVVAHELDHLFQHDSMAFLLNRERAVVQFNAVVIATALIGGIAGAAVAAPTVTAGGTVVQTNASSQIASNILSNAIVTTGQVVGQHVSTTMISGHSQEAELRADRNGARYLWAAGYDVGGMLRVLERLKEVKAAAEKRNEPVISGFINAQPGLDARIGKTREIMKTFKEEK